MAHAITLNHYADHAEQPGLLARLRQSLADHRAYRATVEELQALDDRGLADLGLNRSDIRAPARASVNGN
jgi:uncharacterized protein YjiS (DUF1127 family)